MEAGARRPILAIVSFIFGILSLIAILLFLLGSRRTDYLDPVLISLCLGGILVPPLSFASGIAALRRINRDKASSRARTLAWVGTVLGAGLFIIWTLYWTILFLSGFFVDSINQG